MAYIYLISNDINDKVYIGKTVSTINERYKKHISEAFTELSNYTIHKAMRKYGLEHFQVKKLEECNYEEASNKEKYWIAYYDSYNNGYNETLGGEGNLKYDYNLIYQMFSSGLTQKEIAEKIGCEKHTITRALRTHNIDSNEMKKGKYGNNRQQVIQIDKISNEILNQFSSMTEAAEYEQCSVASISRICNNKQNLNKQYTYIKLGDYNVKTSR